MQQQPTRQRTYHQQQQEDEQSISNSTTLSDKDLDSSVYLGDTGRNDNVLLFGGRNLALSSSNNNGRAIDLSSDTLSSSQSTTTPTEDWTEIPLFALPRTATIQSHTTEASNSSNTSSASNSNSTSNNSLNNNRDSLGQSLFPSHDGNGIFIRDLEESLIMDEGSIYASGLGLDFDSNRRRGTGSTTTSDSRTDRSSLSSSNNGHFRTSTRRSASRSARLGNTRRPLQPIQQYTSSTSPTRLVLSSNINSPTFTSTSLELEEEEEEDERDDGLFTTNSTNSNMGSSWALTEAHLSTLPQSRSSRTDSYNQQNELDEDEEAGHLTLGNKWKAGKEREVIQESRYDDLEDEDEQIKFTFGRGAGRASYPTPPPENTFIKRRHRESGRGKGSQKRSSTSGSHQGAPSISSIIIPTSIQQQSMTLEEIMIHRELIRRKNEKAIFMGRIVGSFMEVDGDTLDLLANSPNTPKATSFISTTPTQTRTGTPTPFRPATWTPESTRRRKGKEAHGIETLFNFAREELGDIEMRNREDREDYEEEEDSGNETETEGISTRARNGLLKSKGAVAEWYKEFRVPTSSTSIIFASTTSNDNNTPTRSHSLSSLPLYLLDSLSPIPLQYSDSNLLESNANGLRRTNSYASGSNTGGESRKYKSTDEINPEFELEGLEYAISYWRRILRKIRWSNST